MSLQRTLSQLEAEILKRGLSLPTQKYSRKDLVKVLATDAIGKLPYSRNLEMRMSIDSPMLCFAHWNLKPSEKSNLELNKNWIAEEKFDGLRCIICYNPEQGFSFFSRNIEVVNYLPNEFTDHVLLIDHGKVTKPSDWKGKFKQEFMLDSEVLINGNIDTSLYRKSGVETGTELNAVTALMAIKAEDAHDIQLNQAQIYFQIFDILRLGDINLTKMKLSIRRQYLEKVVLNMPEGLPFNLSKWVTGDKEQFFQEVLARGGEGIVYKNLEMPYITTESRPRTTQIKRKRRVSDSGKEDIDCFITGYVDATDGKEWAEKGLIGALKLSVYLDNGSEHWVATCSAMPLELRQAMSELGSDGKPRLRQEYYNKVVVVRGQDVSAKSLRLVHAVIDWTRGFRNDKTYLDCTLTKEELTNQIL